MKIRCKWNISIETFDYQIQYRPGRHHQNADTLSRKPNRKCPNVKCTDCYPNSANVGQDDDGRVDSLKLVSVTNVIKDGILFSPYESQASLPSPASGQQDDRQLVMNCITATRLRCLGLSPSRTKGAEVAKQRHSLSCSIRGFRLVLFHS